MLLAVASCVFCKSQALWTKDQFSPGRCVTAPSNNGREGRRLVLQAFVPHGPREERSAERLDVASRDSRVSDLQFPTEAITS